MKATKKQLLENFENTIFEANEKSFVIDGGRIFEFKVPENRRERVEVKFSQAIEAALQELNEEYFAR